MRAESFALITFAALGLSINFIDFFNILRHDSMQASSATWMIDHFSPGEILELQDNSTK